MRVGYARVSTNDQNQDLQLTALKQAGCTRIFDEKVTGARFDRPQLTAAFEFLREGDTLVVWRLDRLARSTKDLIALMGMLAERGCALVSLTEAIDTTTASGRLVFHIFAALAEFERCIIRERTFAGLAAARARGRRGGRPRALKDKDLVVAKALLSDKGITVAEVAERLGVSIQRFTTISHQQKEINNLAHHQYLYN